MQANHPAPASDVPVPAPWLTRGKVISLDRPRIAGILNTTPDSFSDGGRYLELEKAVEQARDMVAAGADILDVGGESTRPGAKPVTPEEEMARVLPVIARLCTEFPALPISVDTTKSAVAAAALDAGAAIVNDVSGLRLDPAIAEVVARYGAGIILMHSRGRAGELASYEHATYGDVVGEVVGELRVAVARALAAGVRPDSIVVDPGVGFSKRSQHSVAVLRGLPRLASLGRPILVGASRKRMVGELSGEAEPAQRLEGTIGVHVAALSLGARLFRVHDVRAHRRALDAAWALLSPVGTVVFPP